MFKVHTFIILLILIHGDKYVNTQSYPDRFYTCNEICTRTSCSTTYIQPQTPDTMSTCICTATEYTIDTDWKELVDYAKSMEINLLFNNQSKTAINELKENLMKILASSTTNLPLSYKTTEYPTVTTENSTNSESKDKNPEICPNSDSFSSLEIVTSLDGNLKENPSIPYVPVKPEIPFIPIVPEIPYVPPKIQIPYIPPKPKVPSVPYVPTQPETQTITTPEAPSPVTPDTSTKSTNLESTSEDNRINPIYSDTPGDTNFDNTLEKVVNFKSPVIIPKTKKNPDEKLEKDQIVRQIQKGNLIPKTDDKILLDNQHRSLNIIINKNQKLKENQKDYQRLEKNQNDPNPNQEELNIRNILNKVIINKPVLIKNAQKQTPEWHDKMEVINGEMIPTKWAVDNPAVRQPENTQIPSETTQQPEPEWHDKMKVIDGQPIMSKWAVDTPALVQVPPREIPIPEITDLPNSEPEWHTKSEIINGKRVLTKWAVKTPAMVQITGAKDIYEEPSGKFELKRNRRSELSGESISVGAPEKEQIVGNQQDVEVSHKIILKNIKSGDEITVTTADTEDKPENTNSNHIIVAPQDTQESSDSSSSQQIISPSITNIVILGKRQQVQKALKHEININPTIAQDIQNSSSSSQTSVTNEINSVSVSGNGESNTVDINPTHAQNIENSKNSTQESSGAFTNAAIVNSNTEEATTGDVIIQQNGNIQNVNSVVNPKSQENPTVGQENPIVGQGNPAGVEIPSTGAEIPTTGGEVPTGGGIPSASAGIPTAVAGIPTAGAGVPSTGAEIPTAGGNHGQQNPATNNNQQNPTKLIGKNILGQKPLGLLNKLKQKSAAQSKQNTEGQNENVKAINRELLEDVAQSENGGEQKILQATANEEISPVKKLKLNLKLPAKLGVQKNEKLGLKKLKVDTKTEEEPAKKESNVETDEGRPKQTENVKPPGLKKLNLRTAVERVKKAEEIKKSLGLKKLKINTKAEDEPNEETPKESEAPKINKSPANSLLEKIKLQRMERQRKLEERLQAAKNRRNKIETTTPENVES